MKTLIGFLLSISIAIAQQAAPVVPFKATLAGGLPSASSYPNALLEITDGKLACDVNSAGGGSVTVLAASVGGAWAPLNCGSVELWTVGTGGVTVNTCVKLDGSNPEKVIENTNSDTGCYGVAQATVSAAGAVLVIKSGLAILTADAAITSGDYVVAGTSTGGYVKDSGSSSALNLLTSTRLIGIALQSAAGSGNTLKIALTPYHFGSQDSEVVNVQSGTSYTFLVSDGGRLVSQSNASAIADTLPQANSSTFVANWWVDVQNTGAGTVTITPTTSTIDGAATLTLTTNQGVRIVSNGTNYFTQRGIGGGGSGLPPGCTITAGGTGPCTITSATIGGAPSAYDVTTGIPTLVNWTGAGTATVLCSINEVIAHDIRCTVSGGGAPGTSGATGATGPSGAIATIGVGGSTQTVQPRLNLIAGTNVTLTPVNNGGTSSLDLTIAASGGGGGISYTYQLADWAFVRTSNTVLTFGANCLSASPCRVTTGGIVRSFTGGPYTITEANSHKGNIFVYVDSAGVLTVGYGGSTFASGDVVGGTGVTAVFPIVAYPSGAFPIERWSSSITNGQWDATGTDDFSAFTAPPTVNCGTQLVPSGSGCAYDQSTPAINPSFNATAAQTTVSGSTSGTAIFAQPFAGTSYKRVIIFFNALLGTASYTFPTAFTNTPSCFASGSVACGILTSTSTSAVTATGTTTTGFIVLEGY